MKNFAIITASIIGFFALIYFVQAIYLNFSNNLEVLENTREAVRICGEDQVKSVSSNGFECKVDPIPVPVPQQ